MSMLHRLAVVAVLALVAWVLVLIVTAPVEATYVPMTAGEAVLFQGDTDG